MEPETTARIPVACPCGARMTAKPALAGKQVECPKCGAGVLVPASLLAIGEPVATAAGPVESVAAPVATLPEPAVVKVLPRRVKLEGLTPDYRIRLDRWWAVAAPHFQAVVGPSIGFLLVFLPVFAVSMF